MKPGIGSPHLELSMKGPISRAAACGERLGIEQHTAGNVLGQACSLFLGSPTHFLLGPQLDGLLLSTMPRSSFVDLCGEWLVLFAWAGEQLVFITSRAVDQIVSCRAAHSFQQRRAASSSNTRRAAGSRVFVSKCKKTKMPPLLHCSKNKPQEQNDNFTIVTSNL
ncbi:hypothetical protein Droror1_Dr00023789 [Drosera rotundifolia]